MFAAMSGLLVVALCAPQAFGDRALGFAIAYGVVRLGHIVPYLLASRDSPGLRRSVLGFRITTAMAIGLLFGASYVNGGVQATLWVMAILLDWGGPAIVGVEGWRLMPAHLPNATTS